MSTSLLDRFRNEKEIGIPRRFSIGAAFVLLSIYCVLFRVLVLLGADAAWTGLVCVFFGVVTIAQMAMFRGAKPRAASVIAGALTAPALFVVVLLDEVFTGWSGLRPIANEFGTFGRIVPVFLMLATTGMIAGYFVGAALAGVFYVLNWIRSPSIPSSELAEVEEPDNPFFDKLSSIYHAVGRVINPAPQGTPLRGAIAMIEIHIAFAFLATPFVGFISPLRLWIVFGILGLVMAFWIGSTELRFYWPLSLAVLGYFLAPWIFAELIKLPSLHNVVNEGDGISRNSTYHFVHFICKAGSVCTGISLAAIIGWTQWLSLRKSDKVRFGHWLLVAACFLMVGLAFLARNRIQAYGKTPKQQLIAKIIANDSRFGLDFQQKFAFLDLNDGLTDADATLALSHFADGGTLFLNGNQFGDATIAALDGKSFMFFSVGSPNISDDSFAQLKSFSAQYLSFNDRPVSSALLAGILKDPTMWGMLETVTFHSVDSPDFDLAPLRKCKSLNSLTFYNVDLSDYDFSQIRVLKGLKRIQLSQCSLTDDAVARLCKSLPNKLESLRLNANDVSDESLARLSKFTQLKKLNVEGNERITAAGIAAFEKANPKCYVGWSEDKD